MKAIGNIAGRATCIVFALAAQLVNTVALFLLWVAYVASPAEDQAQMEHPWMGRK